MAERSKLVRMHITNLGPVGPEGLTIELDNILCLVGANNTGKSTVFRAYELALAPESFVQEKDLCKRAPDQPASVELWVHIPKGTANIAEKWKTEENGLLLVRSRWQWAPATDWKVLRQTWNPEIDEYSTDDKASGLDTVFGSRLPQPFRIGTLDHPEKEHSKLLTLILQPVADRLKASLADEDSPLKMALIDFNEKAQVPVKEERERFHALKNELNRSHGAIFPELEIDFEIGLGEIAIDPVALLLRSSYIKFLEWSQEIDWSKQGTGSQRALFWTMLQARSRLSAIANVMNKTRKTITDGEKQVKKLRKAAEAAKKDETKHKKEQEIEEIEKNLAMLRVADPQEVIKKEGAELALPGYMLLIDEPEVALHPNAIRAASGYLYGLADDPAWQIMITTHSPLFIDPLQDHTTVVRLDRTQTNPTPKTFRADDVGFSDDEKTSLKMLNRFDQGLSEMFFGQRPLLVEGDTEFAVFEKIMNEHANRFPHHSRPALVRARGKWPLCLLIRMLSHFKVSFSILHDADSPKCVDGRQNSAWSANSKIYLAIKEAREAGIHVVHRVSVPDFEHAYVPVEIDMHGRLVDTPGKEKPWSMLEVMRSDEELVAPILELFLELTGPDNPEEPFSLPFEEGITEAVRAWALNNVPMDTRYHMD